jgi:hypothetical protein
MEIRYVNHSIANNFGEYIEVNENLKQFPELHRAILAHELEHTNTKGFTKKDLLLDLQRPTVSYKELLIFMIRNPRSFKQLLPFYKSGDNIIYDINMIIVYTFGFMLVGISTMLALNV